MPSSLSLYYSRSEPNCKGVAVASSTNSRKKQQIIVARRMSWPPASLLENTEELINESELMDILPERGEGKQYIPVVELAALLVQGEYVHARHTWRRWKSNHNPPPLLEDWWKVGAAMMEGKAAQIWQGLAHIQTTHPAPLSTTYATEVGTAYRYRILQFHPSPRPPYLELLNFSSSSELEAFCDEYKVGSKYPETLRSGTSLGSAANDARASLTQVVAFLDPKSDGIRM